MASNGTHIFTFFSGTDSEWQEHFEFEQVGNVFCTLVRLSKKKALKILLLFLWMGFNCLKATEPLRGASLLFTTKFPESPGTHLINLGRLKGTVESGATQWF